MNFKGAGRAAPRGKKTPGSGRKKNSVNKVTAISVKEVKEKCAKLGFDPVEKLIALALRAERDYTAAAKRCDQFAFQYLNAAGKFTAELIPYIHPKLNAMKVEGDGAGRTGLTLVELVDAVYKASKEKNDAGPT